MREKNLTVFLITLGIVLLAVFRGLSAGDLVLGDIREYTLSIPDSTNLGTFDKTELKEELEKFIAKNSNIIGSVDIKQVTHTMGKPVHKKFVIYTVDGLLGDAELVRGPNNKYKIVSARNDSSNIRYGFVKDSRYDDWAYINSSSLVVIGKNVDKKIHRIEMSLGTGLINWSEVFREEYFIRYMPAQYYSAKKFPEGVQVKALDKNNIDITDEVYK